MKHMLGILEDLAKSMNDAGFTPPTHIRPRMSDWLSLLTEVGRLKVERLHGVELLRYTVPPTSGLKLVLVGHVVRVDPDLSC